MKNGNKTDRGRCVIYALGILFCVMLLGRTGFAAEDADQNGRQEFDINAQLLASTGKTYDIQLTISSLTADWEGTVRVRMEDSYDSKGCAYDTVISLPQGSAKQFVVRIPKESLEYTGGAVKVSLLDKTSAVTAERVFKRLLLEGAETVSMGILSDSYQSLTYLDMGGEGLYYGGNEMPIKLLQLDQDNLTDALDSLIFLVIDNYNTGILTDETLDSIKQWVNDGGMLIVGTGKYAENTLRGLDDLDIACDQVKEPGESVYGVDYAVGFSQLSLAELRDTTGRYYMNTDSLIMISSWGDGAVEIVPYALSDLGQIDLADQNLESCLWDLLQNVNGYTRIQYNNGNYGYYDNYIFRRFFRAFGNGGSLNFGVLKLIVIAYVIFVGPILYLILRYMKKRDWYWIAVPVTTLVGICLVYFAGRGFEVVNTRVYSVTVEKLSGGNQEESIPDSDAVTYMHCYDAGHKEWGLQLAERYEYIGPIFESYYGSNDDKYRSHIRREGDRIFAGRNPGAGFEDCYFIAGTSQKLGTGSISCDLDSSANRGITGTVMNGTDHDFKCLALITNDQLFIYGELPAGETCNLEQAKYTSGPMGYGSVTEVLQDYMNEYYRGKDRKDRKDADIVAVLGTGISAIYPAEDPKATLMIGVTDHWDKVMDDDCTETSYGCLYSVQ